MSSEEKEMSTDLALTARDAASVRSALDSVPLFSGLPEAERAVLAAQFEKRATRPGEVLIKQGSQGNVFFILVSGSVAVRREEGGTEKRIADLGPGSFFGELSLISREPRSASVVVEAAGEILTLSRGAFQECLERNPSVAETVEKVAAERRGGGHPELGEWMGSLLKWTGIGPGK